MERMVQSSLGKSPSKGTSQSHKRIDPDFLLAMEVELPPLPQQKIIGKILHNIDSKIALNREINRNLPAHSSAMATTHCAA